MPAAAGSQISVLYDATKGMHTMEGIIWGFCMSSSITRPTQSTVVAV